MSKRAVITGASSGLGAEFARHLAARGYDLLLTARRRDRLEALAAELSVQTEIYIADLALEAEARQFADYLAARDDISLLVNNAGFGTKGFFDEASLDSQLDMHRLHVLATVCLTRAVLPQMLRRNQGAIINVASVAAFARSIQNVSYCATKAWTNAFSEGIHLELAAAQSAVTIQSLCPGFTYTEFHDVLGVDRNQINKALWLSADHVVRDSLDNFERLFVVPGLRYRLFVALWTKLPWRLRVFLESRSPLRRKRP